MAEGPQADRAGSHRRYNPLLDEWVLCSPQRLERPWQGRVERPAAPARAEYDPDCYLCPGNTRARGEHNPAYDHTFAFDNDFPALDSVARGVARGDELLRSEPETGRCRVLCFTPRHDLSLSRMAVGDIARVVDAWAMESEALAATPGVAYVQLFENRGELMGCSNPHPHCQIWATSHVPTIPAKKAESQSRYFASHGSDLLGDYLEREIAEPSRVVVENEHWVVLVPFWAVWPFQTMVLPRRRVGMLSDLTRDERNSLAAALREITSRYDALFACEFPYSMGWAAAPVGREMDPSWRLHAEFLPPLLRSATVRKFVVGYELMAEHQRDLTPEDAAARLRATVATPE